MREIADIVNANYHQLKVIADSETVDVGGLQGKGWSFINIYDLKELRNVYIAMGRLKYKGNILELSEYCKTYLPRQNQEWSYRRVEEYINAFRNFKILSVEDQLKVNLFQDQPYQNELSVNDKEVLKNVFYTYFRFVEIHTWFVDLDSADRKNEVIGFNKDILANQAKALFSFSFNSRFTDAFFNDLGVSPDIFFLDNAIAINRRQMRFWDVYMAWGRTLGVVEKINLGSLDFRSPSPRALSCSYHLKTGKFTFSFYNYIKELYGFTKVFIPELIFNIALKNQRSVENIKQILLKEYSDNREKFSLDNTSEIFIKTSKIGEKENLLFPLYRGSYISHIKLLK